MDTNAVRKNYTAWPTRAFADFDVEQVRSALRNLELGNLGPAAIMADAMLRDDRISGALDTRIKGLMGLPREVLLDAGDGRKRSAITKEVATRLDAGEFGTRAAFRRWQKYGLLLGVCFAQNVYDTDSVPGRWIPKLEPWHPAHFRHDSSRGVWIANTKEGPLDLDLTSGKWAAYALDDVSPWLEGLVRRLAIPWLIRQFAYRDWARYSEVHGLPIRKAKVPADASKESRDNFWAGVANLGSETTIEIPELGNNQGAFDLELVEAASRSYEGFKALLDKCEASIAITILGQNLTTEVKGGSRAAAQVHENVKHDLIADDAITFADAFRMGVLKPYTVFNHGDATLTPYLKINTEPPADLKNDAETMNTVASAVSTFNNAGYDVDIKDIEEKYGIKLKAKPKEAQPAPLDPANPDALPPADPKAAPDAQKGQKAPAKAKGGGTPVLLASGMRLDPYSGFVEGQLYADSLVDATAKAARQSVVNDLAVINGILEEAGSYEELRAGLLEAFPEVADSEFAALTQQALVLASMGGRLAVLQDL